MQVHNSCRKGTGSSGLVGVERNLGTTTAECAKYHGIFVAGVNLPVKRSATAV